MRNGFLIVALLMIFATLAAVGCADQDEQPTATVTSPTVQAADTPTSVPPTATPLSEPLYLLAQVESLEVLPDDEAPDGYAIRLRGTTSNSCSRVEGTVTELKGSVYTIAVVEVQDPPGPDQECVVEETPFDTVVELADIEPGSYTVFVHGLQGTFTVEDVSVAQEPQPTSVAPATGSVSGTVWHDLCQGRAEAESETPAGCILGNEGGFRADGLFDDEPGIPGVRVGIAAGDCAGPATEFAVTDADGEFTFEDLPLGLYCLSIDAADQENAEILTDGAWTSPAGEAEQVVMLEEVSEGQEANFGWDFEFLPLAPYDPETCLNSFAYLEDVNVPDDTEFAPNQAFTKRWLLQNNGTCPWTDEYSVIFVGGDQLSAPDDVPLPRPIAPGQSVEVAVDMIAPAEVGTYRGNWQIADSDGEPFGIDGFIEDAFWLRIVVAEDVTPQAAPADGTGTIGGVVWDDFCLNSDPGTGCIESPEGSGIFIANGTFGSSESGLADITISLASLACPADGSLPAADQVLATAVTAENGQYRFSGLETGMYCIFMDALSEENVDFLIPGNWTYPATGVGRYTFFLDPGEQALDLDFGWDFVD